MHYRALHVFSSSLSCALPSPMTLSLSLSFSLLIIAPKKSVLSKNPIHRGSSSSSFPFDSVRLHDEKARYICFEYFSDWVIHLDRQVILIDFPDTPLPGAFSSRGWASLSEKPSRCTDMFIQEFYFNMHAIDTFVPTFTVVFRGTTCP